MEEGVWKLLLLSFLLTALNEVDSKQCSQEGIAKCQQESNLGPLLVGIGQKIEMHYDVMIESQWLFNLSSENLTKYCNVWGHYESCLQGNVIPGCDDVGAALVSGIDSATQLFCELVKSNNHLAVSQCLIQPSVWEHLQSCMSNIVNDTTGKVEDKNTVCKQSTIEVRGCINREVQEKCGDEVEWWFNAYLRRANKPLFQLYKCGAWPRWVTISLNVVIGIALCVLVLGCTIFCYRKIRRSNIKTLESDVGMTQTSYRQLGRPRLNGGQGDRHRHEVTVIDAAEPDEGTELVAVRDTQTLMSNQVL